MNGADETPTKAKPSELRPADTARQLLRRVLRIAVFAFLTTWSLMLVAAHWIPLKYTGTTRFTLRSDRASLYTYKHDREYTFSADRQLQSALVNSLLNRYSGTALIRLSTPIEGDTDQAKKRCTAFLQAIITYLDQALP